jgi:hypothetical protein
VGFDHRSISASARVSSAVWTRVSTVMAPRSRPRRRRRRAGVLRR